MYEGPLGIDIALLSDDTIGNIDTVSNIFSRLQMVKKKKPALFDKICENSLIRRNLKLDNEEILKLSRKQNNRIARLFTGYAFGLKSPFKYPVNGKPEQARDKDKSVEFTGKQGEIDERGIRPFHNATDFFLTTIKVN